MQQTERKIEVPESYLADVRRALMFYLDTPGILLRYPGTRDLISRTDSLLVGDVWFEDEPEEAPREAPSVGSAPTSDRIDSNTSETTAP